MKNITVWVIAVLALGTIVGTSNAQYGAPPMYPPAAKNCGCENGSTHHHQRTGLFGGFFHRIKTRWFGHNHNQYQPVPYGTGPITSGTVISNSGQPVVIEGTGTPTPGNVIYPSETTPPPVESVPVIINN